MVIISKGTINKFIEQNPRSQEALLRWYDIAKQAQWSNLNDLKKVFPSADYVEDGLVIFNIGGNKYRLIARVIYGARTVYVR